MSSAELTKDREEKGPGPHQWPGALLTRITTISKTHPVERENPTDPAGEERHIGAASTRLNAVGVAVAQYKA